MPGEPTDGGARAWWEKGKLKIAKFIIESTKDETTSRNLLARATKRPASSTLADPISFQRDTTELSAQPLL